MGSVGKPVTEYPEVRLFACRMSDIAGPWADRLKGELSPPGNVCREYYIDVLTDPPADLQGGEANAFKVSTVDRTIVFVLDESPEW